jgi:hypothetical protein
MNRSRIFVVVVLALVAYTAWTMQEVVTGPLRSVITQLTL